MANTIFTNTKCLSGQEITAYLKEELSPDTKHSMEIHLLDCPFCSEALDGYRKHNMQEVFDLKKETAEENMPEQDTLAPTLDKPKTQKSLLTLNRIAATVLFIFMCNAGYQYWNHRAEMQRQDELTEDFRQLESNLRSAATSRKAGSVMPSCFTRTISLNSP